MDISSVSHTTLSGVTPTMANAPVLSSAQNQAERITRQAVAETGSSEKHQTDQQDLTRQRTYPVAEHESVDMEKIVETLNKNGANQLQFSVDQETNQTIVKVIDKETQEVIKQCPSEKAMELSKTLGKLNGYLIKETA